MDAMNPAALQAVVEQLGLDPGNANVSAVPELASLVADQLAAQGADPLMTMLLTSAVTQRSQEGASSEDPDRTEELLQQARTTIRRLKQHLADADVMIEHVAEAFGACPVCWGNSELCERCHGKGRPGSSPPVEEELMAWALPALDRLGLTVVRKNE